MFWDAFVSLAVQAQLFLICSLIIALGFEFANGFHDTANAVATVIYTKSMRARSAVLMSGICNFVGVHIGGIAVAYSIVHLLPVDVLLEVNTNRGLAMVFALLISSILWNVGTWWLGLPASSSHTLIGSILGVGVTNCLSSGVPLATGVNWAKSVEVGFSLLFSPILGFVAAFFLLKLARKLMKSPVLFKEPDGAAPPPWPIRALLIVSGAGVSLAHGSNDGQKGVGLIMLILIGIMPAFYALDNASSEARILEVRQAAAQLGDFFHSRHNEIKSALTKGELSDANPSPAFPHECGIANAVHAAEELQRHLLGLTSFDQLPPEMRYTVRSEILCLDDAARNVQLDLDSLNVEEILELGRLRELLRGPTEYAPEWVILAVSLALGIGTMVGWKRIVVTIGEKIGKARMSYAQGAAAQIVAMSTIGLADVAGLPVSTTHVLSSGVAGTMAASKSGLQASTLRSIALAWVLTLPAAMLLSGLLYLLFVMIAGH